MIKCYNLNEQIPHKVLHIIWSIPHKCNQHLNSLDFCANYFVHFSGNAHDLYKPYKYIAFIKSF